MPGCGSWSLDIRWERAGCQARGPGGNHPSYSHLTGKARRAQRIFESRVSEEGTGWLARVFSSAYTERAARLQRPTEPHAAERACPQRQPGLKPTIFFANCTL